MMNSPYDVLEEHRHLYLNNAWFKAGADTAFQILEWTLKGLALEAEENQRTYEANLELMMHQNFRLTASQKGLCYHDITLGS